MSIIITGDGVSRGICIGQAIVVYKDNIDQAPSFVSKNQVSKEAKKCLDVINKLKTEYKKSSSKIQNNPCRIIIHNYRFFKSYSASRNPWN